MTDMAIIEPTRHVDIRPTGITFDDAITIDEWATIGERLERTDRGLRWIMGDWLVFGADRFGARAAVIADSLSLASGTIANVASVCRRVPHDRRRSELSFSHHEEVAHLDEADQQRMLDTAVREGLSTSVVRQLVREEARARAELGQPTGEDTMPADDERPTPEPKPRAGPGSVETVTLRITGHVDSDVLADGVARVAEGLRVWLHGHGVEATVAIE